MGFSYLSTPAKLVLKTQDRACDSRAFDCHTFFKDKARNYLWQKDSAQVYKETKFSFLCIAIVESPETDTFLLFPLRKSGSIFRRS